MLKFKYGRRVELDFSTNPVTVKQSGTSTMNPEQEMPTLTEEQQNGRDVKEQQNGRDDKEQQNGSNGMEQQNERDEKEQQHGRNDREQQSGRDEKEQQRGRKDKEKQNGRDKKKQKNGRNNRPSARSENDDSFHGVGAGPVTARLRMLEKRYAQVLEVQTKLKIMDKWLQENFLVSIFPSCKVNSDRFREHLPEDQDNPFYAVYLLVQRVKLLEDRVKKLEVGSDETVEPEPFSNYCSATAFRKLRRRKEGGAKRGYGPPAPASKKSKMMPQSTFKPSVKILPKDSNTVVIKTENEEFDTATPDSSTATATLKTSMKSTKEGVETPATGLDDKSKDKDDESKADSKNDETDASGAAKEKQNTEKVDDGQAPEIVAEPTAGVVKMECEVDKAGIIAPKYEEAEEILGEMPVLEDATILPDDNMKIASDQEQGDLDIEQKPDITREKEIGGGDVSGSEASVSSMSSNSKARQFTRRQAAVASAAEEKATEDEKLVVYSTRGRRHTAPRRYTESMEDDIDDSIFKSQQTAEKSPAVGARKAGRKSAASGSKSPDYPTKRKKMAKTTPRKKAAVAQLIDSDDGEEMETPGKKRSSSTSSGARPACVDALINKLMSREVDPDGMILLAETHPTIYVNLEQLVAVVEKSNGKSTRLTRKMTTLIFEDSILAAASPLGTKYYHDPLPTEPLEAMVDFIADSGFHPHYSKNKIYKVVGQVCNEARAGRVSKKFMHPLEAIPGPSGSQQQSVESEDPGSPDTELASSTSETPQAPSQ